MKMYANTKRNKVILSGAFLFLYVLCLPTTLRGILLNAVVMFIILILVCRSIKETTIDRFDVACGLFTVVFLIVSFGVFYYRWKPSSKVYNIASRFKVNVRIFLFIIGIICIVLAFGGVFLLFFYLWNRKKALSIYILCFCLSFCQLQISSGLRIFSGFSSNLLLYLLNLSVVFLFCLLIYSITKKKVLSLLVTSTISTLYSIINQYVISFHGSPLFPSEFANTGTALHVLSEYNFAPAKTIWFILLIFCFQCFLIRILSKKDKGVVCSELCEKHPFCIFCAMAFLVCALIFSPLGIDTTKAWSWKETIETNGFLCSSVCDCRNVLFPLKKIDGYDIEKISINSLQERGESTTEEMYPDIFLILNESFCDLDKCFEINLVDDDPSYMQGFSNIPGAVYGYCASSMIGGGTNNSEFELLTSCSMYLLQTSAPFNYLRMDNLDANIVRYLGALGYQTTAMHCMDPSNYSRDKAYSALEFDQVILGEENFTRSFYGKRKFLDRDNYSDMLNLYENNTSEKPQFFYLLTYQNHGGYKQNDPSLDLVHLENDYGTLNSEVNEFLTSMYLSSQSFGELITRLSTF